MGWNPFKSVKKGVKKFARFSREGSADIARALGGYVGVPSIGNAIGDAIEPGDTASVNATERQDFEYARSLADQRAFQDDSVQRRVADARKAGIHPLAALGYNSPSFIPPQTGGYYEGTENDMASMGQEIGRAVYAGQTARERKAALATQAVIDSLSVQRLGLENRNLEADLEHKRLRNLQLLRTGAPAFPDVNAIRDVGLRELGQGGIERQPLVPASAPVTHAGSEYDLNDPIISQMMENDPIAMMVHMNYRWLKPIYDREMKNIDTHTIQPLKKWWRSRNRAGYSGSW